MGATLQREKLYHDVWRFPVGHLARKMDVTSAKLRTACKAMSIPLPAAGHWAAIRAGAAPATQPLPPQTGPGTFTIGIVPRQSLVEWIAAAAPKEAVRAAPSLPPAVEVSKQTPAPRYVLLHEWAASVFGANAPHQNTLIRWVHEGRIQPQARKIGRRWWVAPAAEYVED